MKILTTVLTGSRLHGLSHEDSDYDWRGVHIHDLKDFLSPFKKLKNTTWIEGDEDNTSYELADFCKLATKGNATILEVFFSDQVKETSESAQTMRDNWTKFIDTNNLVMASKGYASNQYNKMHLFDPSQRAPKFAVAYLRVLWQCTMFLRDGIFYCQIEDEELKNFMLEVKYNFSNELIPELTRRFTAMQQELDEQYDKCTKEDRIIKPDIEWIEDFIYETYTTV